MEQSLNCGELSLSWCIPIGISWENMAQAEALILIKGKYCTITSAIENTGKRGICQNMAGLSFLSETQQMSHPTLKGLLDFQDT